MPVEIWAIIGLSLMGGVIAYLFMRSMWRELSIVIKSGTTPSGMFLPEASRSSSPILYWARVGGIGAWLFFSVAALLGTPAIIGAVVIKVVVPILKNKLGL